MEGGKKKSAKTGGKRKASSGQLAYRKFVKSQFKKYGDSKKAKDIMKLAGAEWKKLSDAEKKKFA